MENSGAQIQHALNSWDFPVVAGVRSNSVAEGLPGAAGCWDREPQVFQASYSSCSLMPCELQDPEVGYQLDVTNLMLLI